jgi:hypothetical protein
MKATTNGPGHQNCGNCRVNAPTDSSQNMTRRANQIANFLDKLIGVIGHDPVRNSTSNSNDKILQNILSKRRVSDFWVKLKSPYALLDVLDGNKLGIVSFT